jgi:hypothetical protein
MPRLPRRLVAAAALMFTGCALSPVYLAERPQLARCLPDGIRMDEYVETDRLGLRVTVGMKLARLGAYADTDGKLHDGQGRPIEFCRPSGGMQLPADVEAEGRARLAELAKTHTIIQMLHDPREPLPQ